MSCSIENSAVEYWSYIAATGASIAVVVVSISGLCESVKWRKEKQTDRSERHLDRKIKLSIRIVTVANKIQRDMVHVRSPYETSKEIKKAKLKLKNMGLLEAQIEEYWHATKAGIFVNRLDTVIQSQDELVNMVPEVRIVLGDDVCDAIWELSSYLSALRLDANKIILDRSQMKSSDYLFMNFEDQGKVDKISGKICKKIKKIDDKCKSSLE